MFGTKYLNLKTKILMKVKVKNEMSLKDKTISGLFWSFSEIIANQGIRFFIQIVLARLLLPEDFGIIAMITVFVAISQSILDSGFKNALIREPNSSQTDYSTVFYFNLTMSFILYILLFLFAPHIGRFYDNLQLILVLRVLSVVIIINAFGLIQRVILIKNIDFKKQTKINIFSSLVSGITAIILALTGYGVWSLVYQILLMQFLQSLILSISNKWIPSLVFSIDSFKRFFNFGWKLLASDLLNTIYKNVYYLIIGKFFNLSTLGYYTNAQKFRDVTSNSITKAVEKVSYPVLSKLQDDNERLKKGYKKIIKNTVFITFPVMIGLSALAEPLFILIFGSKWIQSIPYFQLLCYAGMLFPLHSINLNILKVKGRSDLFLGLEIVKKIIAAISIAIVIIMKLDVIGLIWIALINSVLAFIINSYYSSKLISYSTKDQILDIIPITLISFFMGAMIYIFDHFFNLEPMIKLFFEIPLGLFVYLSLCKIFKIQELQIMLDLAKKIFGKNV